MSGVRHALDAAVDRAVYRPAYAVGFITTNVALWVLLRAAGRRLTRD